MELLSFAQLMNRKIDKMQDLAKLMSWNDSGLDGRCYRARGQDLNDISDLRAAVSNRDWLIAWTMASGLSSSGDMTPEYGRRYIVESALSQDCLEECLVAHSLLSTPSPFMLIEYISSIWADMIGDDELYQGGKSKHIPKGGWDAVKRILLNQLEFDLRLGDSESERKAILEQAEAALGNFDRWIVESEADMYQRWEDGLTIKAIRANT